MNLFHNFTRFEGTRYETSFHPATNIVGKDTHGIMNVVTSPSLRKTDYQHLLAFPINAGPLKNYAAPNMECSLSQCFSRLNQRLIFDFLTGHGEVDKLPCSEISENKELHGLSHQEVFQLPDQKSIYNFLNGDVFQSLAHLVDFGLKSSFGSDTCEALSKCLSQLELENSPDKGACLDNTRHSMQDNGSCSTVSHELLTDHHSLEHLTTVPTVKMNEFTEVIDGNIHSECSSSTSNLFFDSPLHYYQKTFNGVKVSDMVIELGSEANQSYLIENLSGMLSKSNCDAGIFEQTTYQDNLSNFCQHPTNGNSVESTFAIPDPNELMEYLHGSLSSPKFLTSDPSNRGSDNNQFSSYLEYCSSDERAKSDNLSDSIINNAIEDGKNVNEGGILDSFGLANEYEIGAITGAFGEIESPDLPSLPKPSQVEKIRWNWSSRDVDFFHFDFDDHEYLLELYGLNEQDVQLNDDEFWDSPTWPGKRFIQESELEYLDPNSTTAKENDYCCKIVSQVHEKLHESSASRIYYHPSFANLSDTERLLTGIHNNTAYQYENTASLKAFGTSGRSFGYFQEYLAIGSDEVLKFTIPDPDELMEYLHGTFTSPKFLASDPTNEESDNFHLSSNLGTRSSDEVAKSDNLSDFIANESSKYGENVNEDGILNLFGLANGYEIGAMTGAFGETETPDTPSLPEQSQSKKVRWNWANRDVGSSCFDFGDHEDLLELYGLNEQDVQGNDDEFCDSPTWPGKE